jgi:hypothetical protein
MNNFEELLRNYRQDLIDIANGTYQSPLPHPNRIMDGCRELRVAEGRDKQTA